MNYKHFKHLLQCSSGLELRQKSIACIVHISKNKTLLYLKLIVTLVRIAILLDVYIVYACCMIGGWLAGISKRLATSLVMVHGIQG